MAFSVPPSRPDLSLVTFSAGLDFVKLSMTAAQVPPRLKGRYNTQPDKGGATVTLHDPTVDELMELYAACGDVTLLEIEVFVDVHPRASRVPELKVQSLISDVMLGIFAMGLTPKAEDLSAARNLYRKRKGGYLIRPYNLVLPAATDQQLHGWKEENIQVKAYFKTTDQRQPLPVRQWRARVEVRMDGRALRRRGCGSLGDLFGFHYRKRLMPLLSHVSGVVPARSRPTKLTGRLREVHDAALRRLWREEFLKRGVGYAIREGGEIAAGKARLVKDRRLNKRIGDALTRLERQLARKNVRVSERAENRASHS